MKNELTFKNHEKGLAVARALLEEHYVVMLSFEEELLVVNYEWSHDSNRNDVVFMRLDEYDEDTDNLANQIYKDIISDMYRDLLNGEDMNTLIRRLGEKYAE